ncbi:RNA 3'-terminal phosphate cyclase [Candidatus Woesearchaeota archaeon]|nr:RNA 3'-terminal phosphate cyclase [Candidatus Woesearchaeota archaeon]MBI2130956.1 RNA 3'-terminal phosphate cyclase [Candidatus Woesearchaeota archaeon]MBI2661029.1 RNA 3'-terminal phosphate cyclase [Candidatus Woesearchaeota archaeon]
MIELDGSFGEGGGSLVRVALAMSAITGKAFKVDNIRKNRGQPGLKNQHLHGIKAMKELCHAEVKGDCLGSASLEFVPKGLYIRDLAIDIGTAGSITLLLQSLLPPLVFSGKRAILEIRGGTDTEWSPQFDYMKEVFVRYLENFADVDVNLERRGYYPKGNGRVKVVISPKNGGKMDIRKGLIFPEQGRLERIYGISHASSGLKGADVAERQAAAASIHVEKSCKMKPDIRSGYYDADSMGSGITLCAVFSNGNVIGADELGKRGKKSEEVGEEAALKLIREISSGAALDSHMADQALPYMALSGGIIKTSSVSNHCRTNIYTIEKFLGRTFDVDENENVIRCLAK